MSTNDLALGRITSLTQALDRVPNGLDAYELAVRLGLATPGYAHPEQREPFPSRMSDLSNDQLSDLNARYLSEHGRLVELVGSLTGLAKVLQLQDKAARAGARARVRSTWPDGERKPTAQELNDRAEEASEVADVVERVAYVELLLAHAKASLDATKRYLDGIDKEIILRTAQMKARLLG